MFFFFFFFKIYIDNELLLICYTIANFELQMNFRFIWCTCFHWMWFLVSL